MDVQATGSIEAYSPVTGSWSPAGTLVLPRDGHVSIVLSSGQVLTTGGFVGVPSFNASLPATASAELYDPTTGLSTATGSMSSGRVGHSMVLLADGRVLACGGMSAASTYPDSGTEYLFSCDLYVPDSGLWEATGNMTMRAMQAAADGKPYLTWVGFTLSLLPNGQVLASGPPQVFGAYPTPSNCVQQFNLYDPQTRTWSEPAMMAPSNYGPQILLPTGELFLGNSYGSVEECQMGGFAPPESALYNPLTGSEDYAGSGQVFRTEDYFLDTLVLF